MKAFLFLLMLFACSACRHREQEPVFNEEEAREHMINANRILVEQESAAIREFISRHGWSMKETGTGLRVEVYAGGTGSRPTLRDTVSIAYRLFLLDGTFCYEADSLHPLRFILGTGSQPRGLEEGVMLLAPGGSERLVIPAHLAFGPAGDGEKIPGNSALFAEVTLLQPRK
jgi:FKBP-type peptidyl-prolyl cis-trans isomerase